MRNGILKKSAAICMAAVMVFSMTACGKKSDDSDNSAAEDTKNYVYAGEPINIEGVKGDISTPMVVGDKLYFNTYEWIEDEEDAMDTEEDTQKEGKSVYHLYKCDLDGNNVEEIPFAEMAENEYIDKWVVDEQGTFIFLVSSYNESTNTYCIIKMDDTGKEVLRKDVTKDLSIDAYSHVDRMISDTDGNYIVLIESKIVIFDKDANKINEVKSGSWIEGMAITKDGTIVCGRMDGDGAEVKVLDVKSGSFGESYKLDAIIFFEGSDSLMDGQEYDFYYKGSNSVYGYSMADKKSTKVLDLSASNINHQDVRDIIFLPDGTFINSEYDQTANKTVYSRYKKADPSTIANKKTLTIGGDFIDNQLKEAIIKFNKTSDEYNITIKEYSNMADPDMRLTVDIITGNIPDIISLSSLPITQYVSAGVLADLTEYYTKDGLDKELLPTVAEAIQVDGRYYSVAPGMYLDTIAANREIVHGKESWTVAEMLDIIKEQKGKSEPFYFNNRGLILDNILSPAMSDYVDWSTGKCSFDSQEFKDILMICNEIDVDEAERDGISGESLVSMTRSGKVFLENKEMEFEEFVLMSELFNGNVSFIGYPCKDGNGSFFRFNNEFGISARCENKDGAWEFLKTLMTKEYQHNLGVSLPTRKDAYEMRKKEMTTTETYIDEFGVEVSPLSLFLYDSNLKAGPLSEEEVALFESILNNTHKRIETDNTLIEIIWREAQAYFIGDKTMEEVCDIIQNRVSIYVNENR